MPLPNEPAAPQAFAPFPAPVETKPEGVSPEQQAAADAHAAFQAHPHTQLNAILTDLRAPRHDIHDRIGALHSGLTRLVQTVMQHTPPPPEKTDG